MQFTKEQLIEHAKKHIEHAAWMKGKFPDAYKTPATVELARIALAAIQQEPVAYIRAAHRVDGFCYADGIHDKKYHDQHPLSPLKEGDYWQITPLYAAPPAPVVPDERQSLNNGIVGFDEGWNACRAAMLSTRAKSASPLSSTQYDGVSAPGKSDEGLSNAE